MFQRKRTQMTRLATVLLCSASLALLTSTCSSATSAAPARAKSSIGAARCAENRAAGTVTYVSPFGFGAIPGILELFAAEKLGYFSDVCLKVNIVTNSFSGNELVSADTAQFTSEGSAADTLVTIASGANMVSIATLADASQYVLLTRRSITNLKQLAGMKLAIHAPEPVMITEMLSRAGVDTSKITTINDQTYNPKLLPEGKYDALQAYVENEPITLTEAKLPYKEWTPAQFGINGTFNTIVVNGTFLTKHPTATTDFLRAELHAYDYCTVHVTQCVGIEQAAATKAGETFDVVHNTAEWNLSVDLMTKHGLPGKGIGVQSAAEWQPEATALKTFKVLKKVPSLSSAINTAVVNSIYNGTKLIWP